MTYLQGDNPFNSDDDAKKPPRSKKQIERYAKRHNLGIHQKEKKEKRAPLTDIQKTKVKKHLIQGLIGIGSMLGLVKIGTHGEQD